MECGGPKPPLSVVWQVRLRDRLRKRRQEAAAALQSAAARSYTFATLVVRNAMISLA
jgi:hypothetical protein